jgi:hypothetical protein
MTMIQFGAVQLSDPFTYSGDRNFSVAVRYLYSADLNADGFDELIFAGFETQLNTPENYTNTKLAIYGWQNGSFINFTNQWLPGSINAVEGVGDIGFGDFNGDGRIDLYLSAYTDMVHPVNAYELINKGNYFEKINHGLALWQHGVAVADINGDGFSDVFATGYDKPALYLGSPSGLIKQAAGSNRFDGGGSGVALADFIGNGRISAITVDGWIDGVFDTALYGFDQSLQLSRTAILPQSRLGIGGHDVRVRAFDFSHDGLMDAIVFTRAGGSGTNWPISSEIQFLENKGNGTFLDVTSSRLIGFERASNISYTPYFVDINRDGLIDIFISESSFNVRHRSTALLLAQQDGSFVDTGRDQLSAFIADQGGMAGLVRGPNNQFHMVIESHKYGSGDATVKTVALFFPERESAESLSGTLLVDFIEGLGGNDQLMGKRGNDVLDGGSGIDSAIYAGKLSEYSLNSDGGKFRVVDSLQSRDSTDTLTSVERLKFSDTNLALDIGPTQNAGSVYMLYKAAFNRAPDAGGMGYWLAQKDAGSNIVTNIAQGFVASKEFTDKYGTNPTNASYVDKLYQNVLGRAGEAGGVTYWNQELDAGRISKAAVLVQFATLPEGAALVANLIANGIQYKEWVG